MKSMCTFLMMTVCLTVGATGCAHHVVEPMTACNCEKPAPQKQTQKPAMAPDDGESVTYQLVWNKANQAYEWVVSEEHKKALSDAYANVDASVRDLYRRVSSEASKGASNGIDAVRKKR